MNELKPIGSCLINPLDLDRSLAAILAEQLGCDVHVVSDDQIRRDTLAQRAIADPNQWHFRYEQNVQSPAKSCRMAIALPAGGVAVWHSTAENAAQSGRHGLCVLDLEKARFETDQLHAEIESLTSQVMQDFEELSLIRSLSTSLKLSADQNASDDFVLSSLMPLALGVGAVTIAAVMTADQETDLRAPMWTNESDISDDGILSLVRKYADAAKNYPVVQNKASGQDSLGIDGLNEFVMVECASEERLHGWIVACNRIEDDIEDVPWAQLGFTTVQASLMETAANQLASQLHNIRLLKQKEELFTDVVRALVNAVEARDPYTCGHSERVASFARCLASHFGYTSAGLERIYLTGLLHDVGKIAIPDGVLQKPSRLDDSERAIIETHTDAGWRILHELEALQDVLPGVLYHHEHYNGKGYPDQLVGDNIPIDGRILAVCDAFDAMTSDRPYRKGMSIEKAVEILREGAGEYWDPKLIDCFVNHLDEIDRIRIEHQPRQPANRPAPIDGVPAINLGFTVRNESV
ncbi:HD-GYP domain-containing protein [Stieleria varia]|uniref:Cyclic di-GMP phosphodiesterase response regulator RpfG n=1 Tax=Stieleria varia TaxID=2528005 RepID=A0A5C6BDP3_9BACT|nr:HD-GYP domain-containing protein [Stieleria varia]TWU08554.1 Cyclic di-GMP phosphodiesterase response regulator RpfG [Stieleria varia]